MSLITDTYGTRNVDLSLDLTSDVEFSYASLSVEMNIQYHGYELLTLNNQDNSYVRKWDQHYLVSDSQMFSRENTYTDIIEYNIKNGTLITDWQSGILFGINDYFVKDNYNLLVNIGSYSSFSELRNLYSDTSVCYIYDDENLSNDYHTFTIDSNALSNSIRIRKFRLLDNLFYSTSIEYELVTDFTSNNKNEFKYSDGTVTLNTDPFSYIGKRSLPETKENIEASCYNLGFGNGGAKDFYLPIFPVASDDFYAYVIYDNDTVESWRIKDSVIYSISTDTHLLLNKEQGILSCSSTELENFYLLETLSDSSTTVTLYIVDSIKQLPSRGIIIIEDEQIAYTDRSNNILYNCIRGYNSTSAVSHSAGSIVTKEITGFPIPEDAQLYVSYKSTVRADYEIEYPKYRTTNLNIKPSNFIRASQIVQIDTKLRDLDRLVLSCNRDKITSNVYGPLYFGTDTARCSVQALDSNSNPVSDLSITLEIINDGSGFLDGETNSVTKISNYDGFIYSYYNSPVDNEDMSEKYDSIDWNGTSTDFEFANIDTSSSLTEVFIFQLFKHDPIFGTNGRRYPVLTVTTDTTHIGASSKIEIDDYLSDDFLNGIIYITSNTGILYTRDIKYIYNKYVYISEDLPTGTYTYAYALMAQDIAWDSTLLNGVQNILYNWNTSAIHPISGQSGAFCPIFPNSISGTTIKYNLQLPTPYPTDINRNLGGYLIIAPINVSLRAKAIDPYSGQTIYSNIIKFKLVLPSYLTGVSLEDGLPVPHGFKFSIDESNAGSGLGGANFITINKEGGIFGLQLRFAS